MKIEIHCTNCGKVVETHHKKGIKPHKFDGGLLSPYLEGQEVFILSSPEQIATPKGWKIGKHWRRTEEEGGKRFIIHSSGDLCPDCIKELQPEFITKEEFEKFLMEVSGF